MSITVIIILITAVVSFAAFSNQKIMNDLIFYPPAVTYQRQWYRFFTCGFIHADIMHLLFNMYAFYLFGNAVEQAFGALFGSKGRLLYLLLYVSALFVCLLPTYTKHKDDSNYRSLGASGAVSAVVFAYIMLDPMQGIGLIIIPGIYIPGFLFGLIYLVITYLLDKRGRGGINHSAHYWGALYGIGFLIVASYLFSSYHVLDRFIYSIQEYLRTHL